MTNVLKTLTAEEAKQLVELHDLGINAATVKELSSKIYNLAKHGNVDATLINVPENYMTYLRSLGYDVTQVADGLIKISWL